MKNLTLSFFILLASISTFSQQKKVDSIAAIYSDKAWKYYYKQNDSCLFFAEKGITYSIENKSSIGEILNLEVKGIYFEEVKNNYKKASELYFKAIEIAEKKHKDLLTSLYNNLCIMYMVTDYKKSEFYGKKAVEFGIYDTTKKKVKLKSALVNLGIAQSLLKKYDEARTTFDKYLKFKDETEYHKNIAYLRIAKNYKEQGLYKKAQPLFLKVVSLDSLKGKREYAQDYIQLIENSIKLKDKKSINTYLPLLEKGMKNEKNLEVQKGYLKTMTNVYKFLNNSDKALEYQTKLLVINDSINSKFYDKSVAELETKYQTKKKEEQILEEQSKKQLWSSIAVVAFIILTVVALLLYKNNQKRKQLRANKIELESLLNQRNMLLRETHHRVKNSFQMVSSLLQLQAQGSEAEAAITALNNAVERVNSMIVLHQQLYAKDNLLGVDLNAYIQDLINEISNSYDAKSISFETNINSIITNIDTATSIGLLVNELATNSIKYAWNKDTTKKVISLSITNQNDEVFFSMFDNGASKKSDSIKENYGSELIEILIERLDANKLSHDKNDFAIYLKFRNENG